MKLILTILTVATFSLASVSCSKKSDVSTQPNIIVIMADDLGYGDVSAYGATALETPNIDRLAAGGLKFTSGYCSASTCTPTRYSFLTGDYAFRTPGTGIAPPNSPALIPAGKTTIASMLKSVGYRTSVVGKWHLGLGEKDVGPDWNGELKPGPLEIGFDYSYLLPTTNDRVPQVYVENHRVKNLDPNDPLWVSRESPSDDHPNGLTHRDELKMDWSHGHNNTIHNGISRIGFYTGGEAARFRDEDLGDEWVNRSIEVINEKSDEPFFLFFSSHDIHVPRMPHERFHGATDLGFRGDAIVELDWCVGQIIDAVEKAGKSENTIIVFCSDNGPVLDDGYVDGAIEQIGDHTPAGPFKGGKYNVYEAGTRTPFITYWPGSIKPGVSDEMVCTIDMATSFATLAGASIPSDSCLDSLDVLEALLGKSGASGRDNLVQQDNGKDGVYGFRAGDWKLQRHDSGKTKNSNLRLQSVKVDQYRLFNLEEDPKELTDVKAKHPEVFEKMKTQLEEIISAGRTRM